VNCRLVFVQKQHGHKQTPTILAAEQETTISVQITSLERNSHALQFSCTRAAIQANPLPPTRSFSTFWAKNNFFVPNSLL
jgi:hypothetical protein